MNRGSWRFVSVDDGRHESFRLFCFVLQKAMDFEQPWMTDRCISMFPVGLLDGANSSLESLVWS